MFDKYRDLRKMQDEEDSISVNRKLISIIEWIKFIE